MLLIIWTIVLVAAVTLYFRQVYSKFERDGVKCPTPVPLVGTGISIMLRKEHMVEYINRMYQTYSTERFYGQYEFLRPMLVIRDIEPIKQITVKDFEHFLDHRSIVDEKVDPIFGRVLVNLKGQEWKNMRSALSPAFTSSKMRMMLPFIVEVGDQIMESLKLRIEESKNNYIDVEGKDLTTRFANDVIASCAFGLKVNSLAQENNVFFKMGKDITNFQISMIIKMFMFVYLPKVMKMFDLTFFPKSTTDFFKNIIISTIGEREKKHVVRPDMIHLLMEAKKGKLVHEEKPSNDTDAGFATVVESNVGTKALDRDWSDDDLVAQAVLFFLAGFETVSTAMSFALHELAVNPEVQDKLAAEIKENELKNGGKFDYNTIQNMVYMDIVVSELLRLWPPAGVIDRLCTKDYNIGKPHDGAKKDYIVSMLIRCFSTASWSSGIVIWL